MPKQAPGKIWAAAYVAAHTPSILGPGIPADDFSRWVRAAIRAIAIEPFSQFDGAPDLDEVALFVSRNWIRWLDWKQTLDTHE